MPSSPSGPTFIETLGFRLQFHQIGLDRQANSSVSPSLRGCKVQSTQPKSQIALLACYVPYDFVAPGREAETNGPVQC